MATSGSVDFSVNRNEIVKAALRLVGVAKRGITLEAEDLSEASEALNMMIKSWQAQGWHLWKIRELTVFLEKTSQSYSLGSGHITESYVKSELSADASSGASTITVDSITGMSSGDNIGIELTDGTMQWTTINAAPSGSTVTLTDTLTGAAATDNHVYVYTTKASRPLRIIDARTVNSSDYEIPVDIMSRQEYFQIPNKDTASRVNQIYYDPQLDNGKLYVWPTTDTAKTRLQITAYMPIEDFDAEANTPDFPQEWYAALKFGLAAAIGPEHGLALDRQAYLDVKAQGELAQALAFDDGEEDIRFIC